MPPYQPRPHRIVWVLTDERGWFVNEVGPFGGTAGTPDPVDALLVGMAWLSREVAEHRRRIFHATHKGLALGLARVELTQQPGGGWVATSTTGVIPHGTP